VQALVEFFAAAADGIDVQAGDEGDEGVAAVAEAFGFEGRQPAALLFVQAREDKDEALVVLALEEVGTGEAIGALAATNLDVGHDTTSAGIARQR
jgi:hypothetical protein